MALFRSKPRKSIGYFFLGAKREGNKKGIASREKKEYMPGKKRQKDFKRRIIDYRGGGECGGWKTEARGGRKKKNRQFLYRKGVSKRRAA